MSRDLMIHEVVRAKIHYVLLALGLGLIACGGAGIVAAGGSSAPVQNPDSPFQAESAPGSGPPLLIVENGSDITANVDCDGTKSQSLSVPPGERREVRLSAGTYSCKLHGGDATPHYWTETYVTDMTYTFRAITHTRYQ
jgi:hypothetical protein